MGVEASYYNVQYISSKEEGFPETFFETKFSQYTVYYILLYPLWIDKSPQARKVFVYRLNVCRAFASILRLFSLFLYPFTASANCL